MSLVWSERKVTQTETIHITSAAALVDALCEMGCRISTSLPANQAAREAQDRYEKSLQIMSQISPHSLDDATRFEQAVEEAIQASEDLKVKLEAAASETPDTIKVKDANGVSRTFNRKAGTYIVEWTETERRSNRGDVQDIRDEVSRKFSRDLLQANDVAQKRRKEQQANSLKDLKTKNRVLSEKFEQAVNIREKWQLIDKHRLTQVFRQERATEIESRGKAQGFTCKRVVDTKEEIVISLRRRT